MPCVLHRRQMAMEVHVMRQNVLFVLTCPKSTLFLLLLGFTMALDLVCLSLNIDIVTGFANNLLIKHSFCVDGLPASL